MSAKHRALLISTLCLVMVLYIVAKMCQLLMCCLTVMVVYGFAPYLNRGKSEPCAKE